MQIPWTIEFVIKIEGQTVKVSQQPTFLLHFSNISLSFQYKRVYFICKGVEYCVRMISFVEIIYISFTYDSN